MAEPELSHNSPQGAVSFTSSWAEGLSYFDAGIRVVLLAYIAALPFKPLLVVERNGFLILLGLLAIWCLLHGRFFYRKSPYDLPLLSFVLWVGCTIPFSSFPEYSVKEYGKLLQWMVLYFAIREFLGIARYRRMLLYVLSAESAIAIMHGLPQLNGTHPEAVFGSWPSEVWFTTFLVMVIPFGLALMFGDCPSSAKGIGSAMTALATACLVATQSRAGLVALVVELLAVAWLIRTTSVKIMVGVLAGCLVLAIGGALYLKGASAPIAQVDLQQSLPVKAGTATIVHRLDIWKFTLSKIPEHWFVGIGYGGLTYLFLYGNEGETVEPGHTSVKERGTHNILLYLALHVGIPGMVLFAWFYLSAIVTTVREYRTAVDWVSRAVLTGSFVSLTGLFVRLQFDQMFVGSLAVFFWVLLATAVMHYPSQEHAAEGRAVG